MAFWSVFALMTAAALFVVLWPLRRERIATAAQADAEKAVYRDQLDEIERDLAAGNIGASEAQAARTEISRRLLTAHQAEAAANPASAPSNTGRMRHVAGAVAFILLTLGAGGLYLALGSPNLPAQPAAERIAEGHGDSNSVVALFARVEAHLAQHPDDGRGWEVIAPVYMRLGRYEDAVKARSNALRLLGPTAQRYADLGEALVALDDGTVTSQAKEAFDAAIRLDPANVSARFYQGLAAEQDGSREDAARIWRALLAEAPQDAPWTEVVRQALARLESGEAGSPPPSGPAAAKASPEDRPASGQDQMIRGMVERLAARLQQDGSDVDGWIRLVRSYMVLGEGDKARAALADARRALKDDAEKLRRFEEGAKNLGLKG
jgi:cytochrome c-type biogenesis protein CcmH